MRGWTTSDGKKVKKNNFKKILKKISRLPLPLPCAGVVGVFPKNLVRGFKLTVTNNRVFVLFVY